MWYVYILLCKDNSYYTGITLDPDRRFQQHQQGKGGSYTRSHQPIKIIYLETVESKSEALKREYEIKTWTKQEKKQRLNLV